MDDKTIESWVKVTKGFLWLLIYLSIVISCIGITVYIWKIALS